jgi:hypothetical protein
MQHTSFFPCFSTGSSLKIPSTISFGKAKIPEILANNKLLIKPRLTTSVANMVLGIVSTCVASKRHHDAVFILADDRKEIEQPFDILRTILVANATITN